MSIESDINQSKFASEHRKANVNLVYTYYWVIERQKKVIEEFGLTMQQFNILRILRGNRAPLSTLQIRDRMIYKMSDTSRIVDRLLIKDLVKKVPSKTDKRMVDISITKKGLKLLTESDVEEYRLDNVSSKLTTTEAKQLSRLLEKMRSLD